MVEAFHEMAEDSAVAHVRGDRETRLRDGINIALDSPPVAWRIALYVCATVIEV